MKRVAAVDHGGTACRHTGEFDRRLNRLRSRIGEEHSLQVWNMPQQALGKNARQR